MSEDVTYFRDKLASLIRAIGKFAPLQDESGAGFCIGSDVVSRPKSVEGVGNKNADAKRDEKCCNSFKHGCFQAMARVRSRLRCTVKAIR